MPSFYQTHIRPASNFENNKVADVFYSDENKPSLIWQIVRNPLYFMPDNYNKRRLRKWNRKNQTLSGQSDGNTVHEKYGFEEWAFIEIANDIRNIKNQLLAKIEEVAG